MQTGVFLPIFDELADPATLARLAVRAEDRGWDGVFLWDHVIYRPPVTSATDPWIALAAIASATERVQIGPMVTPLARRRPWIVARQAVALDHLSGGRFVLGLGLGPRLERGRAVALRRGGRRPPPGGDARRGSRRAHRACWRASRSTTAASTTRSTTSRSCPPPARPGGMPIWLAARWPNRRPVARALRHDGVFLIDTDDPGSPGRHRGRRRRPRPPVRHRGQRTPGRGRRRVAGCGRDLVAGRASMPSTSRWRRWRPPSTPARRL